MFGRQNIDITIYCHAFTYPEPPFFRFRGDLSKKSKIATCGYKRKIASFFRKLQNRRNTSRHFDSNLQIIKILSKITIFLIDNSRLMLQIVTPILLFNYNQFIYNLSITVYTNQNLLTRVYVFVSKVTVYPHRNRLKFYSKNEGPDA